MTAITGAAARRGLTLSAWIAAVFLLVAAWWVVNSTPNNADVVAPVLVATPAGEWGTGRNITARTTGGTFSNEAIETEAYPGNWLFLDVEAAAVLYQEHLWLATLTVNGMTFNASTRLYGTLFGTALVPGVPTAGVVAFELPTNLTGGEAELRLGTLADPTIDTVIAIPLSLDEYQRVDSIELRSPTWATP